MLLKILKYLCYELFHKILGDTDPLWLCVSRLMMCEIQK